MGQGTPPPTEKRITCEVQQYSYTIVPHHWHGTMFSMVRPHWCSSRDPRSSSCDPSCTCSPCTAARCRASGRCSDTEHSHLDTTLSVNNSRLNIRIWHSDSESFVISLLNILILSSSRIVISDYWTKLTFQTSLSLTFSALENEVTAGNSEFLHTFPLVLNAPVAGRQTDGPRDAGLEPFSSPTVGQPAPVWSVRCEVGYQC